MRCTAFAFLVFVTSVGTTVAQTCGTGETLLKNDVLPAAGGGIGQVSVIRGLCEGEAAGAVFDVSSFGGTVRVNTAAVGLFSGGGATGNQIQANCEIYDGITWSSGIPTLGPKIFDYTQRTGSGLGLTSSAINTLDTRQYNVVATSGVLVVAWRSAVNLNGSCQTGFTTNFVTDNTCSLFCACSAGSQKNLIDIQGQGWRDAATATVGGIAICGGLINAYNGNWVIRACVEGIGCNAPIALGPGTAGSGGIGPVLTTSGGNSQIGNASFGFTVAAALGGATSAMLFGAEQTIPFAGGNLYVLPVLGIPLALGGQPGTPGAGFGTFPLPLPNNPTLLGVGLPVQAAVIDPAAQLSIALSNGLKIVIC